MIKTALLLLTSLLAAGIAPVASQLRSGQSNIKRNERGLNGRSAFESFFDIGYLTSGNGHPDLPLAAQTLASSYNELVSEGYADPFDIRMDKVEILEVGTRRKLSDEEVRNLQLGDLNVLLRAIGNCVGCPSDSTFTLQLGRRDRGLKSSKSYKSSKKSGKGNSYPYDSAMPGDGNGYDYGYGTSMPGNGNAKGGDSKGNSKGGAMPMLPTEQELLKAYSRQIRKMDLNIVDVVSLDEIDEPKFSTGKGQSDKSGKKSNKSSGDDSSRASKSGKKSSKSSSNDSSKAGKSGKKSSKSSSNDSSKASKSGKKSSKSSGSSYGKGSKADNKYSKKSSSGSSKSKSARPTCPPVEPVGSFSGQFTSYFRSLYALIMESNVGIEDGVAALTMAYNKVAEKYAADIIMEESFPFDPTSRRRLSFQEVELRRSLQLLLDFNIQVIGFCNGCEQQMTMGNQVSARRQLDDDGLDCPLPGLPTEEEVRIEYNNVIEKLDIPNIEDCVELEEIDRVSYSLFVLPLLSSRFIPWFSHALLPRLEQPVVKSSKSSKSSSSSDQSTRRRR